MSVQGSGSERSLSSGNASQAPQQPQQQHDPMFVRGKDLFVRLQDNEVREYRNFKKLDD